MRIEALRNRSRRATALAAAVLALGLTGGAAATTSLALAANDAGSAALALRTASVRSTLDTTLQRYDDTMHDLVAVAGATPRAQLAGTVDDIVGDRLDGAHQVLVIDADRRVLAQHSVDGSTPPTTTRLDPEPELTRTLELARRTGSLAVSPAHVLPSDADRPSDHREQAVEIASPVHVGRSRGWVVVSVRAGDLLHAALGNAGVTGVTIALTETSPDGVTAEVAQWSQGGDGTATGDAVQRLDSPLAEYTWHLTVRPTTPLVGAARSAAAPLTMLGAFLLSLALAGVALAAGTARDRATERERTAAAELAAAREQARDHQQAAAGELAAANERARRAEERHRERESELAGFGVTAGESLHTPLHTIVGFTELLLTESPRLDEESRGFVNRIGAATQRMLTVVDELVAYASAGDAALKLEPVESTLLALDVVADRLQEPGEQPSIDVGELPAVSADAVLLRRVIDQFVDNAVRFVRHGTPARIGIGARELDGGWWRIEVTDRGIGVGEEQRARIFAPFHRAPSAEGYPGAGLGLAVCARIVAMHGGEIGVDPNPGGGSIFWFTVAGVDLREPANSPAGEW